MRLAQIGRDAIVRKAHGFILLFTVNIGVLRCPLYQTNVRCVQKPWLNKGMMNGEEFYSQRHAIHRQNQS